MGTSSFSWGQRALTKGSNPRPSLVPFTERAAASMKWKQAAWELPQSVAEVLLPLLGLSIYFGQIVRNIRCIVQGHILERDWESLGNDYRKGLRSHPSSLNFLDHALFITCNIHRVPPRDLQALRCLHSPSSVRGLTQQPGDISCAFLT